MSHNPMTELESDAAPRRGRGIYLLPNLFTTACLFSGFYAILISMKGNFEAAAVAVFVAMVMDGLDGRVARLTHTQSAFGAEYDSLSDMVAFGLAPALVVYQWALAGLGKVGWAAAFIYAAATALRLARFNTQIGVADKRYFQGLPSPSAAAIIAAAIWLASDYGLPGPGLSWAAAGITALAGLLMVSNFRFHSFKELDIRGRVPFLFAVILMLVFALIFFQPPLLLFLGFTIYAVSGPVLTLVRLRQRRAERHAAVRGHGRS
jgi:CDP-diacylglycerol---serine O-phosphatidyltransferase